MNFLLQCLAFLEYAVSVFKGPLLIIPFSVLAIIEDDPILFRIALGMICERITAHYHAKDIFNQYPVLKNCMNICFLFSSVWQFRLLRLNVSGMMEVTTMVVRLLWILNRITILSIPFFIWLRMILSVEELQNYRECIKTLNE
jgi:hypothetical protein